METVVQRIGLNDAIHSYASLENRYPPNIHLIYAYRTVKIKSIIRHEWVTTKVAEPWAETMLIVSATICALKNRFQVQ